MARTKSGKDPWRWALSSSKRLVREFLSFLRVNLCFSKIASRVLHGRVPFRDLGGCSTRPFFNVEPLIYFRNQQVTFLQAKALLEMCAWENIYSIEWRSRFSRTRKILSHSTRRKPFIKPSRDRCTITFWDIKALVSFYYYYFVKS